MDNNSYFRKQHPDIVTTSIFQNQGYASLRTGKIFHGGIDDMVSWTKAASGRSKHRQPPSPVATGQALVRRTILRVHHSQIVWRAPRLPIESWCLRGETFGDYKIATRAIEYLETTGQALFLQLASISAQSADGAKKFFDLYDQNKIPLPPDFTRPQRRRVSGYLNPASQRVDLFIVRFLAG